MKITLALQKLNNFYSFNNKSADIKSSNFIPAHNNVSHINFQGKNLLTQDVFVKAKLISKEQNAEAFVDEILDRLYSNDDKKSPGFVSYFNSLLLKYFS